MALKMPIHTNAGLVNPYGLALRFKRWDDLIFDQQNKTFKAAAAVLNPFVPVTQGEGDEASLWGAEIDLVPGQWTDGSYRAYYHTTTLPENFIANVVEFQIYNGNWQTPNPTDLALRLMNINIGSHNNPGSLGALLNRSLALTARSVVLMEFLADYVSSVTGKPKP